MKPYGSQTLERVHFKLDTGADLTTISKKELNVLGYSTEWIRENIVKEDKRKLSSAGGKGVTAYYVPIQIANLFGKDFRNWPFYIHVEEDRDFPNLLGIDMLAHFNFEFNFDTGYLGIEPAKNPLIKLPLMSGQEVGGLSSDMPDM
jgi:hypothetical protein